MRLADYLRLDIPLPADPLEAAIATRARQTRLAELVQRIMSAAYPDFDECVDVLDMHARATGADTLGDA